MFSLDIFTALHARGRAAQAVATERSFLGASSCKLHGRKATRPSHWQVRRSALRRHLPLAHDKPTLKNCPIVLFGRSQGIFLAAASEPPDNAPLENAELFPFVLLIRATRVAGKKLARRGFPLPSLVSRWIHFSIFAAARETKTTTSRSRAAAARCPWPARTADKLINMAFQLRAPWIPTERLTCSSHAILNCQTKLSRSVKLSPLVETMHWRPPN